MKKEISFFIMICLVLLLITCKKDKTVTNEPPKLSYDNIIVSAEYTNSTTIPIVNGYAAGYYCSINDEISFTALATDNENDKIIYQWQCSGGAFLDNIDNERTVKWIAPSIVSNPPYTQEFIISVGVGDADHPNSKEFEIDIYVFPNNSYAPIISSTPTSSSILATSATISGSIADDNGFPVTSRGVCYNTTGNPTINDMKETNGSGIGTFSTTLSGLNESTKYYAKVFGTNSKGTSYSSQVNFTTANSTGTNTVTVVFDGVTYNLTTSSFCPNCNPIGIAATGSNLFPALNIGTNLLTQTGSISLAASCTTLIMPEISFLFNSTPSGAYYNDYYCTNATQSTHNGTIIITSISGTSIKGNFSATLYLNSDVSKPKAISGSFDIK
jgi:hypothetical protein